MYMFMEYIFVILVVRLIKMTIDLDYCNIFFNVNNKKLRWILCIGVYLAAVLADIMFDSEFISIMESFIIMYIIMQAYSGALDKKVLFASMNVALECIADMGTSYIMSDGIVMSSINNYNASGNMEIYYYFPEQFVSIMLFYFLIIIVKNIYRTKEYDDMSYNWLYFMLLAVMSIGVWYIIARGLILTQEGLICVGAALLVMNMVSYKLYESVSDAYRYEKEYEKLKEQMDIYECQISTSIENDRVVRSLRHDMKLHLEELKLLAAGRKYDELENYISAMTEDAKPLYNMIGTGNPSVDGILDYMCSKAQDKGVTVRRKLRIPEDVELSTYDMNIILGNLLENAIENTLKTDNPYIELTIKYQSGPIYINVTNTCIADQKVVDGKYLTTKTDIEGNADKGYGADKADKVKQNNHNRVKHGYGLDNVKRCVDKYSGTIKLNCTGELFIAEVLLYVPVKVYKK